MPLAFRAPLPFSSERGGNSRERGEEHSRRSGGEAERTSLNRRAFPRECPPSFRSDFVFFFSRAFFFEKKKTGGRNNKEAVDSEPEAKS